MGLSSALANGGQFRQTTDRRFHLRSNPRYGEVVLPHPLLMSNSVLSSCPRDMADVVSVTQPPICDSKPPQRKAGRVLIHFGDPELFGADLPGAEEVSLSQGRLAALKTKMSEAALSHFVTWLATLERITADLGDDATAELASMSGLAI